MAPLKARKALAATRKLADERARQNLGHSRLSRQDASQSNPKSIIPPRRPPPSKPLQNVDGDAESGPGLAARLKTFLSLGGFDPSGITTARALSSPGRTHRAQRILPSSESTNRSQIQRPKLNTVPVAGSVAGVNGSHERKVTPPVSSRIPNVRKLLRRQRKNSAKRLAKWQQRHDVALTTVGSLRNTLGLVDEAQRMEDGVFVTIDTESSREIGISTLDTRDIRDIKPDHLARNWISKIKHQHFVIAGTSPCAAPNRTATALFCNSHVVVRAEALALVLSQLKLARQPSLDYPLRKVHLAGQSIGSDIAVLRTMGLDLSGRTGSHFTFDSIFDTYELCHASVDTGAKYYGRTLGELARRLGVDERYWDGHTVLGIHNASNDAAYTMMVLLLFAVRWHDLARDLTPTAKDPVRPTYVRRLTRSERRAARRTTKSRLQGLVSEPDHVPRTGLFRTIGNTVHGLLWGWKG